jgi:hypothetical protein
VLSGGGTVSSGGLYTSESTHGGVAWVQVAVGTATSNCEIQMEMDAEINISGDPDLPAAAGNATTVTDDGCASVIVYPLDGSIMPGSMAPPVVQWDAAAGSNAHVLTASSDYTLLHVYTTLTSWTVTQDLWDSLTGYDPGSIISFSVASGTWNGSEFTSDLCTASSDVSVQATDFALNGSVIYWEPSIAAGLRRIDFGDTTSFAFPVSSGNPMTTCVGCHGVNLANPDLVAVADLMSVFVVDTANTSTPVVPSSWSRLGSAGALDPTGTRMVRSAMGSLVLENAQTGASLGTVPTQGSAAAFPNWSPDGQTLVYGACTQGGSSEFGSGGCSLRTIEVLPSDDWGADNLLASPPSGWNYYYPSFSPDSQWIVFNRGQGDSYNNPGGELMMIRADASIGPIELANANGVPNSHNSWPKWAPENGDDYAWFAFTSSRDYGNVATATSQMWVVAVDLDLAQQGFDPSHAPAWFPGQNSGAPSYIPTWLPRWLP